MKSKNNNSINIHKNKQEGLAFFSQNIQGFSSKFLEIELFLEKFKYDVVCLTEHWLKKYQVESINFENYCVGNFYSREAMIHGGSLILLKNSIKYKDRSDISLLSVEHTIELSCVELDRHVIVCVYRPPNMQNLNVFSSVMEDVLRKTCSNSKFTIICGDFNVDLLENSSNCINLLGLFKSFNLSNVFLEPTRVTSTSATCIDNIFTNCDYLHKEVVNKLPSDHSGLIVNFDTTTTVQNKEISYRQITKKKLELLNCHLGSDLCGQIHDSECPSEIYSKLLSIIKTQFDKILPLKHKNIQSRFVFSDWATPGIRVSRERLFELYGLKPYNNNEAFHRHVSKYSKIFKAVCKQAKSLYISSIIKNADNKIKATWKIINNETGRNKINNNEFNLNTVNGYISTNSKVAQEFESFFKDVPLKTTKDLKSSSTLSVDLLKSNVKECPSEFRFQYTNPHAVIKAFKEINVKSTEDLWGMSVKVCRSFIETIAPYLACIFNKSLDQGTFPDLMKHSKVVPLFKSGDSTEPNNYRPVSILPVLSKVFEKLMLNQMLCHFNTNAIFHDQQYGFTKGRCTTDAGVSLIKHIFTSWEKAYDAIGIFCDLSKAFDCVEHETLLLKLEHYGIRGTSLNLLKSYLQNRHFKVQINKINSQGANISMGVPQGSILGPFLFLAYINDLPFLFQNEPHMVLFADDTSLIFKINRRTNNYDEVNNAIVKVQNWFTVNNLVLNDKKTKCIRFVLPNVQGNDCDILLNGKKLEFVKETTFLGITVDEKLQWGPHITSLAGRLSSAAYAVWKIRQLTDIDTARLVYFSYFHSIMSYGILLWGQAADIDSIFILQKRAVRAIYKLGRRESLRERFKEINIMTVPCQIIYENIMFVRKNLHLFGKVSDRHKYQTRHRNKLSQTPFRLAKVRKSFMGFCIKCYNKIPEKILELSDTKFKLCIKKTLCKQAYYKLNEYIEDKNAWKLAIPAPQDNN